MVILIDALDEALINKDKVNIVDLLTKTQYLPSNVRLILTLRPETGILRNLRRYIPEPEEISLTSGRGLTYSDHDVKQYVLHTLTTSPQLPDKFISNHSNDAFADAVKSRSDGNFLYVKHLIRMLNEQEEKISLESLERLPLGLDKIYIELLDRILNDNRNSWEQEYKPILGVLAVAQESLIEDLISGFVSMENAKTRRVLVSLRQLLDVNDSLPATQRTYAFFHLSFAEFLFDADRAEEYWCGETMKLNNSIGK